MNQNTSEILGLYKTLGKATDGNDRPILSIYKVASVTTYMRERKFDLSTGKEQGPLDHEIDVRALSESVNELNQEAATVNELVAFIDSVGEVEKEIKIAG